MPGALLFDLDDTLVPEEPSAVAAFEATARAVPGIDAQRLAADARAHARALWYAAPTHPYCKRIGISSWEGLWCRFEGDGETVRALRDWAPDYRREAWSRALADQGVDDPALAVELGERFGVERRALHAPFPDAALLDDLRGRYALGLVTNGAAGLRAVWINRFGLPRPAGRDDLVEITGLDGLRAVL